MEAEPFDGVRRWVACLLLGVLTFFALAFFYLRAGYLYDADSYVHLAVSRLYAEEGMVRGLPWPRFSVMHEEYGDKEVLFHVALMPLVMTTDPAVAGRVALAMFGAALVFGLALLFTRWLGWLGLLVPWWLLFAAPPFLNRVIRLRPEILGLLLFVAAAAFFIRRRWVGLGVVAVLFPLSYTAFHVLAGLVAIWVLLEWVRQRTFEWRPLVATGAGIVIGNLIHPHPIDHLKIWWMQNISYFGMKRVVEVEEEILPPSMQELLLVNGGWWLLAIPVLALIVARRGKFPITRETIVYGSTGLLFFVLYVRMGRMALYATPFLALALAAGMAGVRVDRVWGSVLAVLMLVGIPIGMTFNMRLPFFEHTLRGIEVTSEGELEQFGRAVPEGARIAAEWGDTQLYAFWAPQGRYLNMYDPLFMAARNPDAYEALRAIFEGRAPDIPPVVKGILQSDFLAVQTPWDNPALNRILDGDPRWRVRHRGANLLLELRKPDNGRFLTDWMVEGNDWQGRFRPVDPWRAMVSPPRPGCFAFRTTIDCDGCVLDFRVKGTASVTVDGRKVRDVESDDGLSPWTTIDHAGEGALLVEYCGESGGFFMFQRDRSTGEPG